MIKPASPTPWSILKLAEVIGDVVPGGVVNIITGPGAEVGKALASNPRIAKIAFTGETATGRLIMQYAAQNIILSTTELGGKSPNIFFSDILAEDDEFLDKAVEGLVLYAFNKGEVCTCPSRALIQESIYDKFMERCLDRIRRIKQGNPLDLSTRGPSSSSTSVTASPRAFPSLPVQTSTSPQDRVPARRGQRPRPRRPSPGDDRSRGGQLRATSRQTASRLRRLRRLPGSDRLSCGRGPHMPHGCVGSGEEEAFMPVRPAHQVGRLSVASSHVDDLALAAPLTHVPPTDIDLITH